MKTIFDEIEKLVIAPKSTLHRAQQYVPSQENQIINTLKGGYYELTNNSAERVVKESVVERKNREFSAIFEGAKANAVALILKKLTEVNNLTNNILEELMPWNMKSSFSKHEVSTQ